jgi:hypothetical protein
LVGQRCETFYVPCTVCELQFINKIRGIQARMQYKIIRDEDVVGETLMEQSFESLSEEAVKED